MMKCSIRQYAGLAVLAGLVHALPVSAAITTDWVTVGNAGNPANTTGYGAVSYSYKIGRCEVTNAQYAGFLNAVDPAGANSYGIYNSNMASNARGGITFNSAAVNGAKYSVKSNMGNKPVNYVSWFDAARFANWLHNGQGGGSTETGAYTLAGAMSGTMQKNANAQFWLPSEDEWYKAAYYDPRIGGTGGYWLYPTQSNTVPITASADPGGGVSNPGPNVVNYANGAVWNGQTGNLTTVDSAGASTYYGATDMAGNVWEWNDSASGTARGLRGGAWSYDELYMRSSHRFGGTSTAEVDFIGFRIATVPEPGPLVLTMALGAVLCARRKR